MTIETMVAIYQELNIDKDIKNQFIQSLRAAHRMGFDEGMRRCNEVNKMTMDLLMPALMGTKKCLT